MRTTLPRLAVLCLVNLGASSCGSDTIAVLVHVKNLPSGISVLQVNATLDGKPALQAAEFTQNLDQFAITLPKSAIEAGQLVIEVTGADADRCKLSQKSRIDTTVSKDISYSESTVSLQALSEALCTLTVEVAGEGTVTPDPVGVVPDKIGIACKIPGPCDYPKMAGRVVTLTSSRGGSYFVTDWGPSCPGQSYLPVAKVPSRACHPSTDSDLVAALSVGAHHGDGSEAASANSALYHAHPALPGAGPSLLRRAGAGAV